LACCGRNTFFLRGSRQDERGSEFGGKSSRNSMSGLLVQTSFFHFTCNVLLLPPFFVRVRNTHDRSKIRGITGDWRGWGARRSAGHGRGWVFNKVRSDAQNLMHNKRSWKGNPVVRTCVCVCVCACACVCAPRTHCTRWGTLGSDESSRVSLAELSPESAGEDGPEDGSLESKKQRFEKQLERIDEDWRKTCALTRSKRAKFRSRARPRR
jgi:hypothetical protein